MAEAGCELVSSRSGQQYEVADPRRLRRLLEQKLTLDRTLRSNFMAGLEDHLCPDDVLHAALRPMVAASAVRPERQRPPAACCCCAARQQPSVPPARAGRGRDGR